MLIRLKQNLPGFEEAAFISLIDLILILILILLDKLLNHLEIFLVSTLVLVLLYFFIESYLSFRILSFVLLVKCRNHFVALIFCSSLSVLLDFGQDAGSFTLSRLELTMLR